LVFYYRSFFFPFWRRTSVQLFWPFLSGFPRIVHLSAPDRLWGVPSTLSSFGLFIVVHIPPLSIDGSGVEGCSLPSNSFGGHSVRFLLNTCAIAVHLMVSFFFFFFFFFSFFFSFCFAGEILLPPNRFFRGSLFCSGRSPFLPLSLYALTTDYCFLRSPSNFRGIAFLSPGPQRDFW